jgi:hypothetical protein
MFFYWRKYSTVICNILLKITTICGKICDSFMVKCVYGVDNQNTLQFLQDVITNKAKVLLPSSGIDDRSRF